jgi:preprotein translocase subunit SecE
VARDRKRAKQRRDRAGAGRGRPSTPPGSSGAQQAAELPSEQNIPGALEHASAEVDEFDAAIIAGAGGVAADGVTPESIQPDSIEDDPKHLQEDEIEAEALAEGDVTADELQEPGGEVARTGGVSPEHASGAPVRKGNRVIGFLSASWAELQRVQWPDRRQVTQATAVVLGFVAVAGAYLGLADFVAKEIVEFIL